MEINADISYNESTSKLPKFIKKMASKKQRKKLIEEIDKFAMSHYILNRNNVYEALVYFFDSKDIYKPKYLKVYKPDSDEIDDRIEGLIVFDYIECLLHLENNDDDIDISIKYNDPKGKMATLKATRNKLDDPSGPLADEIKRVNDYLVAEIADFLLFNIEKFEEK